MFDERKKMNKFVKYCPSVWVVRSDELYEKGDIIEVQTGRGRFVEREIFKRLGERNGSFFYSVIIVGKSFAEKKAEKYEEFAQRAEERAAAWYEKAQEGREFLALAEPIKVGHHSERRHRALIDRNYRRMGNSVRESELAEEHKRKAEYWRSKKEEINLSMPESLEYFKAELEKAQQIYEGMKNGTIQREHSMSLSYARNKVKKLEKNLNFAKFLWEADDA